MQRSVFRLTQLKAKVQHKRFECVATEGSRAFIGTQDGTILVYEVKPQQHGYDFDSTCIQILRASKAKKPITQLAVLPDLGVTVVLSDKLVSLFRYVPESQGTPPDQGPIALEPHANLNTARGALLFAVKKDHRKYWLAVVAGSKVFVLSWHETAETFDLYKDYDLPLPDVVQVCSWSGKNLLLGFRKEYVLLDTQSSKTVPLFQPGKSGKPVACPVDGMGECLVSLDDNVGVRLNLDGKPASKVGIRWANVPTSVCYFHPYVLGVVDRSSVEVHYPWNAAPAPGSGGTAVPSMCQIIALKHAERLSTPSCVNYDQPRPTERSPDGPPKRELIICLTDDSCINLLEMLPIAEQVTNLFRQKQFDEALELCKLCVGEVTPQLHTELLLQHGNFFFGQKRYQDAIAKFLDAQADPRLVISFFPKYLVKAVEQGWKPAIAIQGQAVMKTLGGAKEEALAALLGFISPKRRSPTPDATFPLRQAQLQGATDDVLLQVAIDMAMLRAFSDLQQHNSVADLLQRPNWLVAEECEDLFLAEGDYVSLGLLFRQMKEHTRALQLLRTVGFNGEPSPTVPRETPSRGILDLVRKALESGEDLSHGLLHKGAIAKLVRSYAKEGDDHEVLRAQLMGVTMSVHYTTTLDPDLQPVIYEFSSWVLQNFPPEYAVKIFTEAKTPIEPINVATHLESPGMPPGVAATFLERTLGANVNAVADPELHNRYAAALLRVAESDELSREARVARVKALNHFLSASQYYNAEVVLTRLMSSPRIEMLQRERAIVYHCLGRHEDAIRMFLDESKPEEAERYAQNVARENAAKGTGGDAFKFLLTAHLRPGEGKSPRLDEALALIRKNPQMDALGALEVLPDTVPLQELHGFIRNAIAQRQSTARTKEFQLNILRTHHRDVQTKATRVRKECTRIDRDVVCAQCGRKMAVSASVFARFPNGEVVHQACLREGREHVSPSTHEDYRRSVDIR